MHFWMDVNPVGTTKPMQKSSNYESLICAKYHAFFMSEERIFVIYFTLSNNELTVMEEIVIVIRRIIHSE